MTHLAATALSVVLAAAGVYALCRHLSCARLPALFGAAAWAFSEALLAPGAGAPPLAHAASSVLVPFAVAGVFSRERRRWPFLALALVCITLRWRLGPAEGAGAAALEALVLAVLAGLGAQRLWDGEGGAAFVIGAAAALVAAVRGSDAGGAVVLVEALPAAAALALVAVMSRETRARKGLVALVALFAMQRALEIGVDAAAGAARHSVATAAKTLPRP
ncbi:MAG TPA: hypothetical protein VN032_13075 [Thermoanaerobaculia bacterium]|jgi:hypothetical protein|nr:hypothetical protein [Thermoanaerobaculia bacterium]